jgi:hypothetical protein
MPSHLLDHLNAVWLVALFLCLGLAPGTVMTRALRVPRYFWTPLVLASASLIGYAIFWAYFFFPSYARLLSSTVVIVAAAWFAVVMTSKAHRETLRDRDAWLPILLSAILMVAYQGYVLWAGVTSTVRFTTPLPPEDNIFPLYFANRLFNGLYTPSQAPAPFTTLLLDAQSSDRPPLQAGVVLAVRALGLGSGRLTVTLWSYGMLGAACQLGWIPALYALGRVLHFSRRQFTYVFVACACSGFFLMHSIYTWPKLYAAWLFITGLALGLYLIREPYARRRVAVATTAGALVALAMLAHGGVFFSIAAMPILLLNRQVRRGLRFRELLPAALVAALLMAPWMAYQRLYDPPGNRLPKMHLAGVMVNDSRGTLEAMREAYGKLTFGEIAYTRWLNVKEQGLVFGVSSRDHFADWIQWQQFFHSGPALAFLLIGFCALFSRHLRDAAEPEWLVTPGVAPPRVVGLLQVTWLAGFALLVWLLLMFVPQYAIIHHGSYATMALLFFCASAYLALMPAWLRRTTLALHLALFAAGWFTMRTLHVLQPEAPAPKWCWWAAVVMVAAFGGFALAVRLAPEPEVALPTYPIFDPTRMRAASADAARTAEPGA